MGSDECAVCGDAADQGFECSYCGAVHCTAHRLPESHSCPGDPKSPTTATRENEPDSDSNTQRGTTFNREDPAKKIERVTTASPASRRDADPDEDISDPREPTFEASSPGLNPDGSLAADDTADSNEPDRPHPSNQSSTTRRLYHKLRATVRAPFGLLREYTMPLLVVVVLLAVVVGLLIST
ncbi:AN1-type zinc finger domain-containing protein [Halobellus ruber]|uniref:AN1-type domain-containing protein n=1 Tax=Halobellus ruber TaxID=2761102 RepID=A0A7J9SE41_9EURY|nr:hypothetical protein [Halobellus ruber]